MNPLTKKTCRRGRTHPTSIPSTYAPVAGSTATHGQVGGTVVNQGADVPPVDFAPARYGASPIGFSRPMPSPSEG
jgi:hypothetical protein